MTGKLKSISGRTLTIEGDDGPVDVEAANGAVITLDGGKAKLSDLEAGDNVEVDGDPATSIAATR